MNDQFDTSVLIVGAGPTGLALAAQLQRFGIDFIVVEKNEAITPYSKALGVHARTLEIYDQLGVADEAIRRGQIADKARFISHGQVRGEVDLSHIGEGMSAYPFILILEQSKNEALLYEQLRQHGGDVRWEHTLVDFTQDEHGVTARLATGSGQRSEIRARYLVGCDGARSPVRTSLGLGFAGSTFERLFYVADVRIDWSLSHDALHVCMTRESFVLFFPMQGEARWRIVGVFPEGHEQEAGEVLYEEIEQRIKREAELPLEISDVNWFSVYKVHSRHVDRFGLGRCFVAGDAGHIHSPAGAQGMNTGIQDAYNLGWKLALVVKGRADPALLDTYNEERLPNAMRLIQTTDRLFHLAADANRFASFMRLNVFPFFAGRLLKLDSVPKRIFPQISQIAIEYRDSRLSAKREIPGFLVQAGDRLPYVRIDGEALNRQLRAPVFHLASFGTLSAPASPDPLLVQTHVFELDDEVRRAFGANAPFHVLLRPDHHIALISTDANPLPEIEAHLKRMLADIN